MQPFVDLAMSFMERCASYGALGPLVHDFSATVDQFGFRYFMMTRLPAIDEDAEPYVIAHTWPADWLNRYRAGAYFRHDPVSHFSLTRARPFTWGEATDGTPPTRIAGQIFSEAASVGLVDGLGFPMGDAASVQAVVSLAADRRVDLDALGRHMLHLVCLHAEMRAAELMEIARPRSAPLSERECEVLRWVAAGKSQWEVSVILSLSERTIDHHLRHARTKLHAHTTTHAIARAVKNREITL